MQFNWEILSIDYSLNDQGEPESVFNYHWKCTATENGVSKTSYGMQPVPNSQQELAGIPTSDADAVSKLFSIMDKTEVETKLSDFLTRKGRPKKGKGKPWNFPANTKSWRTGAAYTAGDVIFFEGETYEVQTDHVSELGLTPDTSPSLFRKYRKPIPEVVTGWVVGEGIAAGDRRRYRGVLYQANETHDTEFGLEPDVAIDLWSEV